MKVKKESEKVGLKLYLQETNIMASGPVTSWQTDRWGNSGNSGRLYFLGSKITEDGDWSHEIKRCLLLGRKAMTSLDSILKSRDITLPTKVHLVKAMVFPVVMYGCESWTIKKPKCQRIDAFELWCWRRPLRVPWTARTSNQSTLKEISPGCSLEGLMLKLKLQYFGHLMRRADLFAKTLMLGKIEGRRRRGWQRMIWLDSITDTMDMGLRGLWELVMDREAWNTFVHGATKSQTLLSDWTELNNIFHQVCHFERFFFFHNNDPPFFFSIHLWPSPILFHSFFGYWSLVFSQVLSPLDSPVLHAFNSVSELLKNSGSYSLSGCFYSWISQVRYPHLTPTSVTSDLVPFL